MGRRWGNGDGVCVSASDGSGYATQASTDALKADVTLQPVHQAEEQQEQQPTESLQPKRKAAPHPTSELLPGYRIALRDGKVGEVEFVATTGEALISFDDGRARERPCFEETQREWIEGIWAQQGWVHPSEARVTQIRHKLRERKDVADYRHARRCEQGREKGLTTSSLASEVGRPEEWVRWVWQQKNIPKPKHMEHWDAAGFCEARYLKGQYHKEGLYETIVQGVDWQQDRVWRVHKDTDGNWNLRTVKQCEKNGCGRSLQRVPDSTVKIGPGDSGVPSNARPHGNWVCEKKCEGCLKPELTTPLGDNFYWWCPKCRWYVCQECQQQLPDKPTSKQIRGWHRGECPELDELVYKVVDDFNLPDPQAHYGGTARYTIKMNWYPDGNSQVTDHRHDIWTILVSLGSPRVLNVDYARVLMEDGDAILFGTQKHGVPVGPPTQGGRLSLVFMFKPDIQIEKAALHLAGRTVPGFKNRSRAPIVDLTEDDDEDMGTLGECKEEDLSSLCALGFSEAEARQALVACEGDATSAANLLLGVD